MTPANPCTRIVAKIIFPVTDLDEAGAFYRSLGFEVDYFDDGYAWVTHRGEEILHLALSPDVDREANRAAGYFHVQDAAGRHAAWSSSGVEVGPIQDHPWRMREFLLRDSSGNRLRVGQNLEGAEQ